MLKTLSVTIIWNRQSFASFELGLQVGHVVVLVAEASRLAQTHAVDDAGVVQFVAEDGVLLAEQRFE